jgi:putative inorganic carbon (hco3(-)) transporter
MSIEMPGRWREDGPVCLAGAAAVTAEVSIAGSMALLGLALAALLVSGRKLRRPPFTAAVLFWMGWTLVALAASGHARGGFPQVKKLLWFLMLPVVFSALRSLRDIRGVAIGWAAAASLSAMWGFEQYVRKYMATRQFFYFAYLNDRITGFMSHWMTFSGHMMMALLLIGAMLLFSNKRKGAGWLVAAGVLAGVALLLAETRSMWAGAAAGAIWLLWFKKKWLVAAVPALAAAVLLVNPFARFGIDLRQRALDLIQPEHNVTDSSAHRAVLRRVGWEMIKAHPFVGVGPEQVGPQFMQYLPADIPRPIPATWYYQHLHNIYFHFAAERGVPALVALLWLLLGSLTLFFKTVRKLPPDSEARWALHGAIAVIIAVMVSGYGEVNLGDSEVLAMFLGVLACGFVAVEQARKTGTVPAQAAEATVPR